MQIARPVSDRHDQRTLVRTQRMRADAFARQLRMRVVQRSRSLPDAHGERARRSVAPRRRLIPPESGDRGMCAQCLVLRRRQHAPEVEAPGSPPLAVAPVLQPACGDTVQVEQVSRIALAVLTCGVAAG